MISIRVHSVYKNTLTDSHLSGHVVFALTTVQSLTKVKLSLKGIHQVHFIESFQTKDGKTVGTAPFNNDEEVITVSWPNLLVNKNGSLGHFTDTSSQLFNLLPTEFFDYDNIPIGTTPFPNKPNSVYQLPPGNYALPFTFLFPDNIPDTISTSHSSIKYLFTASIETINNVGNINASKPLKVCKTLPPTNPSIYVSENTWPGKVQYKISVNNQLPSISSTMNISLIFIPLVKRLLLGKIKAEIYRFIKIHTNRSNSFDENTFKSEKLVYVTSLPALPKQQLPNDSWNLKARIPLGQFVQSMAAKQMSVTYRLILIIDLINPDGHVSQIKTKIPLLFYISPEQLQRNDGYIPETNLVPELFLLPPDDDTPLNVPNPITPPSYIQSRNDILYSPITTPISTPLGSTTNISQLADLPNSRPKSGSKISSLPLRNQSTPDYRKVYDDDLDQIGEPTPIYQESSNSYSLPVTRASSPILRRPTHNNTSQETSPHLTTLSSFPLSGSLSRRVLSLNSNLNRLADVQ